MKNLFMKLLLISLLLAMSTASHALDVQTHQAINEYIAQKSLNGFSLGTYLQNQLGLENGIKEQFNSLEVSAWLRDGGLYEDKPPEWYSIPYLRSLNHFHNPLTDQGYGIGNSAIQWSQLAKGTQSPGGHYSWHDVRDYFYNALTSPVKSDRDTNFADTFRGLGQLMHLVHDMSVPEHSRNDGHVFYCYEDWVREAPFSNYSSQRKILSNALVNPFFYNKDALPLASKIPGAPVPIANLFDTNQYTGSNPDVTVQDDIGLAEFSNANFLSPDTMIYSGFPSDFPNPDWPNVVEHSPTDETTGEKTTYLKKLGMGEAEGGKTGSGVHVEHLAAVRLPYKYLPQDKKYGKYLSLNEDRVYADYAKLLLPRAVGYSSQLLSYFFRGQIDMVPDDATGSGYVIKNNSDEDMSGKFEIYYDNTSDQRIIVNQDGWTFDLGKKSSGNNTSSNISFTPPADAKEPGKYIVVFKGRLGNEDGDAVAAGISTKAFAVYGGESLTAAYFVARLDSANSDKWRMEYGSDDDWHTALTSIAVHEDKAYFTSFTSTSDDYGFTYHYKLTAISISNGETIWEQDLGSATDSTVGFEVERIRADSSGLYLVGINYGNFSSGQYTQRHMEKRDLNGAVVWQAAVAGYPGTLSDLALTADYAYVANLAYSALPSGNILRFNKSNGQYSQVADGSFVSVTSSNPAEAAPFVYGATSWDESMPRLLQIGGWSITYKGESDAVSNPYPYLPGGAYPTGIEPSPYIIKDAGAEAVDGRCLTADDSGVYAVIVKPFDLYCWLQNVDGQWSWAWALVIDHGLAVKKYSHQGSLLWNLDFPGNSDGLSDKGPYCNQLAVNSDGLFFAGHNYDPFGPNSGFITKINASTGSIVWTRTGPTGPDSEYTAVDAIDSK